MKFTKHFLTLCVLGIFLCISCNKSYETTNNTFMQEARIASPKMMAKSAVYANSDNFDATVSTQRKLNGNNVIAEATEENINIQQERKLIKTGNISLEIENLHEAESSLNQWCKTYDGYISASYNEERLANYTVRIPAENFDDAMNSLGDIGTVKNRNINTQDVSEEFYDLESRLNTRKILKERLQSYLSNAKDMKDMLEIEKELNNTLSELESMEGRLRRLSNRIEYSTITVYFSLPYRTTEAGFQWPDFGENFRYFLANIVDFFAGFLQVLLYAIICGIPILAVIILGYWLLFGKIGLLRKLLKKLKPQKD